VRSVDGLVTVGVINLWRFARKLVDKLGGGKREWQSGGSALHFGLHDHVSVRSRLHKIASIILNVRCRSQKRSCRDGCRTSARTSSVASS
jgi:hypothetical protein